MEVEPDPEAKAESDVDAEAVEDGIFEDEADGEFKVGRRAAVLEA